MLRFLYNVLFLIAIPFILLRLLWRSRKQPAYRRRWGERFGFFPITKQQQQGIWVHVVSLGEFIAAIPLIQALLERYPSMPITVTSMTVTGSNRIQQTFGDRVFHVYVPYDIPCVVKRFLKRVQPRLVIILETELWPSILYSCKAHKIPLAIINARLSARSMRGYQRMATFTRNTLQCVTFLAAQSAADAERFIQLGMLAERVFVTGNIKFDRVNLKPIAEAAHDLRKSFGDRLVWIAASTHESEEQKVLQAFAEILKILPNVLLILVPRHPERFTAIHELCREHNYQVITRSSHQLCTANTQIFLGDTIGELALFYNAADVAFVGGSLVPIGGHNVLEPVSENIATITGPFMSNFTDITNLLLAAEALIQVQDANELAQAVVMLLTDVARRNHLQRQGEIVMAQNRGAVEKNLALLAPYLK